MLRAAHFTLATESFVVNLATRWRALAVLVPSAALAQTPTSREDAVCRATWSPPQTLRTPSGAPVFVDIRSTVTWRSRLVIAGDPSYRWASPDAAGFLPGERPSNQLFAAAVVSDDGTATPLSMPAGVMQLMQPRVGTDAEHRLHIAFGMKRTLSQRGVDVHPDSVMHTVWNGRTWDALDRVPIRGEVLWDPISVSGLSATALGLAFVAPINSRDSMTAAFMVREHGTWRSGLLATGGAAAAYLRLAHVQRSLVMAWIGAEADVRGDDHNALFVRQSNDNGATWSRRTRLEPVGSGAAYDPTLVSAGGANVYIVWAKKSRRIGLPDSLVAAVSHDAGLTWHVLPAHHVAGGFTTLSAAPDGQRVIAGFRDAAEDRVHVRVLSSTGWITPADDAGSVATGTPFIVSAGRGPLRVLFPERIPTRVATGDGRGQTLATAMQSVAVRCRTR